MAALVRDEMERLGYAVEVDALGTVTGTLGAGDGPCVLLDAHMDTVGVTDRAAWSADPAGELRDGRLYGRGSVDMKGPLAALVHGAAAAAARGRVVVSASIAEEMIEGYATVEVARRVRPDVAVICEPSHRTVVVGQRGRAELIVEVEGRPSHSSRPDLGVNAVEAMADVLRRGARAGAARAPGARPRDPRRHRRRQPALSGAVGAARPLHGDLRPADAARRGRGRGARSAARRRRGGRRAARRDRAGDDRRSIASTPTRARRSRRPTSRPPGTRAPTLRSPARRWARSAASPATGCSAPTAAGRRRSGSPRSASGPATRRSPTASTSTSSSPSWRPARATTPRWSRRSRREAGRQPARRPGRARGRRAPTTSIARCPATRRRRSWTRAPPPRRSASRACGSRTSRAGWGCPRSRSSARHGRSTGRSRPAATARGSPARPTATTAARSPAWRASAASRPRSSCRRT